MIPAFRVVVFCTAFAMRSDCMYCSMHHSAAYGASTGDVFATVTVLFLDSTLVCDKISGAGPQSMSCMNFSLGRSLLVFNVAVMRGVEDITISASWMFWDM